MDIGNLLIGSLRDVPIAQRIETSLGAIEARFGTVKALALGIDNLAMSDGRYSQTAADILCRRWAAEGGSDEAVSDAAGKRVFGDASLHARRQLVEAMGKTGRADAAERLIADIEPVLAQAALRLVLEQATLGKPARVQPTAEGNLEISRSLATVLGQMGLHVPAGSHPAGVAIETPVAIFGGFEAHEQTCIGAFSSSRSALPPELARMGRYSSIAAGVTFLGAEPGTNGLATSVFADRLPFVRDADMGSPLLVAGLAAPERRAALVIGNDVRIEQGAVIRCGVTIGDGAVVMAGAVVSEDVPAYAVVAGNPALVVRMRFDEHTIERLLEAAWWRYAMWDLAEVRFDDTEMALEDLAALSAEPYAPGWTSIAALAEKALQGELLFGSARWQASVRQGKQDSPGLEAMIAYTVRTDRLPEQLANLASAIPGSAMAGLQAAGAAW